MSLHLSNSSSSSETSAYKPYLGAPVSTRVGSSKARSSFVTSGIVIVVVVLGMAFLVVSYYRVFGRWCARRSRLRTRRRNRTLGNDMLDFDTALIQSATNGLEDALIQKIPVYMFKHGDGLIESTDCSICLSDFRNSDQLRLLPKCDHAFHLSCIDVWLKSHSNCPLCRAPILSESATATLTSDQRQNVPLLELPAFVPESVNEEDQVVPPSSAIFPSDAEMEEESSIRHFEMQDPRSYGFPVRIRILTRAFSLPERKHGDKNRSHPMRRHSSTRRQPFPPLRRLNSTGSFHEGLLTIFDCRRKAKPSNRSTVDASSAIPEECRNTRSTPVEGDFAVIDVTSMASSSNNCRMESLISSDIMFKSTSRSEELKACTPKTGIDKATKRTSFSHELKTKGKFGDVEDFAALRKSWSHAAAYRMRRSFSGERLFQILNNKRNVCEMQRHPI